MELLYLDNSDYGNFYDKILINGAVDLENLAIPFR